MTRYSINEIYNNVIKILTFYGVNKGEAEIITNYMLTTDMCGVHTHGLAILSSHIDRIIRKGYNLTECPEVIKDLGNFAVVDSKNTFGFVSGEFCMQLAIEKSLEKGIGIVFAHNCNTYGAAFYYTKLASDKKLIGITFCNSPTAMSPYGGKEKLLGTNPLAISIPGKEEGPILFDMATSIVAKSKINELRKQKEKIPLGWALDVKGNPTVDPEEAIKGIILPMAGAKGYGLALTIDIIAGILSGAEYSEGVNRFYSDDNKGMNVGQVFVVLNPEIIYSEEFYTKVDEYIRRLHNSKSLSENRVRFPGETKLEEYEKSKKEGVLLSDTTISSINNLLKRCKC